MFTPSTLYPQTRSPGALSTTSPVKVSAYTVEMSPGTCGGHEGQNIAALGVEEQLRAAAEKQLLG